MNIACPNCQSAVSTGLDQPSQSITCPSCGSSFTLFDPTKTRPYREKELESIGRFDIIELLGSGHFGDVWLAHDRTLERRVAIKLPRKEELDRQDVELFLREAQAAAQLQHPNIVRVHEVGKVRDGLYIVSEYIVGVNLSDFLAEHRLPADRVARLCATLAEALEHAHENGVVHRDLKPGNVLLDAAGQPHLTDFGLAKRDSGEISITADGRILGTPAYMSPEQARGDAHSADRRSDVYSLGVMLYEMLTGQRPFQGKSKLMLIQQVLIEDPAPPRRLKRDVPRDLETICLKAIEKDPSRRYQTAREMARDLERFLNGHPILARPAGRLERGWRWLRRNPLPTAIAVLITALAGALGVIALRGDRGGSSTGQGGNGVLPGSPGDPGAVATPAPRKVRVATNPPGARIALAPVSKVTGEYDEAAVARPEGLTPVEIDLAPGRYLIVAEIEGLGFVEAYRTVPASGEERVMAPYPHRQWTMEDRLVVFPPIEIVHEADALRGLVHVPAGDFDMGTTDPGADHIHLRHVDAFWVEPYEVTVKDWRDTMSSLPAPLREANLPDGAPIRHISYDAALEYAEKRGRRLPLEAEYEYIATNQGTTWGPWGDDMTRIVDWSIGNVGEPTYDATPGDNPIHGLYSGVAEWTDSVRLAYPGAEKSLLHPDTPAELKIDLIQPALREVFLRGHVARGGPYSMMSGTPNTKEWLFGPRMRSGVDNDTRLPGLGLRCYRGATPRIAATPAP
jgi:eukaryotic-like serine/threonine-protein kinase